MKKSTHSKKVLRQFLYEFGGPRKVAKQIKASHTTLYNLINPRLNKRLSERIAVELHKFASKKGVKLDMGKINPEYKDVFN